MNTETIERFHDGDRVCFVGDSLVARNQAMPVVIEAYKERFPNEKIRFFNCGVSGGTAKHAYDSFEDDVLICKPTHAVVAFGVNDSGRTRLSKERSAERYQYLKERFDRYRHYLTALCEKVTQNGIELILCTPAPFDEYTETSIPTFHGGYALICEYANFVRALAKEKGYRLVDYHAYMCELMQTEPLFGDDHVHPTAHGFYRMAQFFLANQGIEACEEHAEIPAYFAKWREKLFVYRSIAAAECMIINNYFLSQEEKDTIMREYLEKKKYGERTGVGAYFESIANRYLEFKSKEFDLAREIFEIYDKDIL